MIHQQPYLVEGAKAWMMVSNASKLPSFILEAFYFKGELKMIKIEDLFRGNERIRIIVDKDDYQTFLKFTKENECLWNNGRIIRPEFDKPETNNDTIVITKDKLIHHPHGWITFMSLQNTPKYYFKDIKKDLIIDIELEEEQKRRESIEKREKDLAERKASFEKYLKHQRELSNKQLKYQNCTKGLPEYFHVKCNDINEMIDVFGVLEKYGYENVYNVSPLYLQDEPNVLFLDNKYMKFYPINSTNYEFAVMSKQKFYNAKEIIDMFDSIFNK